MMNVSMFTLTEWTTRLQPSASIPNYYAPMIAVPYRQDVIAVHCICSDYYSVLDVVRFANYAKDLLERRRVHA